MLKKKKCIVNVKINCSNNPFAYVRTKEDIDILLTNITYHVPNPELVTKPVLQLLSILISFVVHECNPEDRNFISLKKLLDVSYPKDEDITDTTLDYLVSSAKNEDLKKEFTIFKENFWSIQSEKYLDALDNCSKVLQSDSVNESNCLTNLKDKADILQALVESADGRTFDFWFYQHSSPENIVNISVQATTPILAEVYTIYPYLYHFTDTDPLSESFLLHLISLYDKAYAKAAKSKISTEVRNKFMLDKDTPMEPSSSFYPNAGENMRRTVALHEAAHGVIYYLFGCANLAFIDIRPTQKNWGHIKEVSSRDYITQFEDLAFEVILDYAGYVIEDSTLFTGTSDIRKATKAVRKWVERHTPAFDYGLIVFEELEVPKKTWVAYECISLCQRFFAMTQDIVKRNIDLISSLATELEKKEFMYSQEVFDFLLNIDQERFGAEKKRILQQESGASNDLE